MSWQQKQFGVAQKVMTPERFHCTQQQLTFMRCDRIRSHAIRCEFPKL